jgi:hypothetical protein
MKASVIPLTDPQWCAFVSSQPDATPFHLPEWAALLADCYGFTPFVLAALETDGGVVAGVPAMAVRSPLGRLRWVSLPFSDSCPVLARDAACADGFAEAVTAHVLAGRATGLEVRGALPAGEHRFPVEAGYTFALDLPPDPADLHPSKGHRQNRNLAVRRGVEVRRGTGPADVAEFYRLHTLTRRRQGVPVQPRRFFQLIGERLLTTGHGFVVTATLDGAAIASGLFLTHNRTIVAKFRASDPAHQDTGAGFLVDWDAIAGACTEGYATLDLGRTDRGEDGQRRYKSGWGAVERPLVYTHISASAPGASRPSVGELPKRIIRHSPLWVTRALGEVLYGWTA